MIFGNNNINNNTNENNNSISNTEKITYTLDNIPEYLGEPYIDINNGVPSFSKEDFNTECFEHYSDLDDKGRCGVAFANLGKETMPTDKDKRTSLTDITPSGWQDDEEGILNGKSLYNRCHLIAFSLSAENKNKENLITGTNYFNISGMTTFESNVRNYLKANIDNHVLYRVTPIFEGDNLLASGVHLEAQSVEDNTIHYNVYIYNVQPGVKINYATGEFEVEQ